MVFTVKATYRGETRKLSFSESNNSFPSFDEISNQLYRVFPITNNFFLSKLLFSPDSSKSRILVARQVRSHSDYARAIAPLIDRSFPNPLLRFSVFDEPPHKVPSGDTWPNIPSPVQPLTPISISHIPPPPIIYSTQFAAMEVDSSTPASTAQSTLFPQHSTEPQHKSETPTPRPLVRTDIESLITKFKQDLDGILLRTFGPTLPSFHPIHVTPTPPPPPPTLPIMCLYKFCMPCAKIFQGPWYTCEKCDIVVCPNCHDSQSSGFCFVSSGPHVLKKETCPACPAPATSSTNGAPSTTTTSIQPSIPPFGPWPNLVPLPLPPILPSTLPSVSPPAPSQPSPTPTPTIPAPPSAVVHEGVGCDVCQKTIEGARHKCLDCPDYDLCTSCISSGAAERHNPFHEFFDILEPGRVIVHTVHSRSQPAPDPQSVPQPVQDDVVVHSAVCNLCDSRILGIRYKCLDCPDFDTCSSCFEIIHEHHPSHGFVKIRNINDYIKASEVDRPMHFATCNSCTKGIFGVRYKCMHPNCPDFDLCETCEALPILVHPANHPLLKMKSADTLVPTVYRAGQDVFVPSNHPLEDSVTADSHRATSAFSYGHMRNPLSRGFASPVISPPSPFFYKTTSSRSRSPSPPRSIPGGLPLFPRHEIVRRPPSPPVPSFAIGRNDFKDIEPLLYPCRSPSPPRWSVFEPCPKPAGNTEGLNQTNLKWPSLSNNDTKESSPAIPGSFSFLTPQPVSLAAPSHSWPCIPDFEHLMEENNNTSVEGLRDSIATAFSRPLDVPTIEPTPVQIDQAEEVEILRQTLEAAFSNPVPVPVPAASSATAIEESPLTGAEALLSRPAVERDGLEMVQASEAPVTSGVHSLAALLEGYTSASPLDSSTSFSVSGSSEVPLNVAEENAPLSADFIADVTVPDGQIFPPGAEFVKCWRMVNSGTRDWPASTELIFLAGDSLARDKSVLPSVHVGVVKAGEEIDLWTGELKAPEAPGRYMSYWRLRDENAHFGVNIWLDITVAEAGQVSNTSSESSMTSSSVIVMPQAVDVLVRSSSPGTPVTARSKPTTETEDSVSEADSEASSISLVSIPASLDEEEVEWQDTEDIPAENAREETEEYVVLYDENSSEED